MSYASPWGEDVMARGAIRSDARTCCVWFPSSLLHFGNAGNGTCHELAVALPKT